MIYPDRRKEILTGAFIFTLLFGGFGLGELTLRVHNLERFGTMSLSDPAEPDPSTSQFAVDAEGILRPSPGTSSAGIHINDLGFRGPPLKLPKPTSRIRVAFLGSSTTFDPYAGSDEATFPSVVRDLLQAKFPTCRFDYVNAGFPGLPLSKFDFVLDHDIAPVAPDVVVIYPTVFRQEMRQIATSKGWVVKEKESPSYFEKFSLLLQVIRKNSRVITQERNALRPEGKIAIDPTEFGQDFEARLEAVIRHAQSLSGVVVVVNQNSEVRRGQSFEEEMAVALRDLRIMPYLSFDALLDLRDAAYAATARAAAQTGAVLVSDAIPADRTYWGDSEHFLSAGGRLLAQSVAQGLSDAGQFNNLMKARASSCRPPSKPEVAKLGRGLEGTVEDSQKQ